jgi:hypothetical protein
MYKTQLAKPWAFAEDVQYRTYKLVSVFQQFIARAAVSYKRYLP